MAPLRAEPDDAAEQVTQALRGEPLLLEERRPGWARVLTAYEYPGWVRAEALGPPGGDEWLPRARPGDVVEEARAYLEAPYEWGGMTERGIDCSGLVHMAFRRLGRLVPRDSDQQEAAGQPVRGGDERRGDVACYDGHVAFWIGGGWILHATGRDGAGAVVEEPEPQDLAARRRKFVRFQ